MVKLAIIEVEKPLEMGIDLREFQKIHQISHFLRERNP